MLKSLDNETIDLVCCDPPFAKNQTFTGQIKPRLKDSEIAEEKALLKKWGIDSKAAAEDAGLMWPYDDPATSEAKFADIWRYEKVVHEDWITQLADDWGPVSRVIDASLQCNGENMAAYLTYMAVRMIEIHRVLKPTGSFFIHCDWEANSYLRLLLDGIFGKDNFINEISWCYPSGGQPPKNGFPKKHDTIFFYAKNAKRNKFTQEYKPLTEKQIKKFAQKDENGRRYKEYKKGDKIYRTYLDEHKGSPVSSWWTDIHSLGQAIGGENTGYPTQKPVALAERIIKAATDENDVVFDPFAGCAYIPVAAERNNRQWIACDISIRSLTVLKRQFKKFDYSVDGETDEAKLGLSLADTFTRSPFDLPERTDADPTEMPDIPKLPDRPFKVPASDIPEAKMKELLLEISGYEAWCCGFANRTREGDVIRTANNFHLDHIDPKSKRGSNQIMFRAPLCQHHNNTKKDRRIHLEELRDEIEKAGELQVPRDQLVDLAEAREKATAIYADPKHNPAASRPKLPLGK